MLGYIDSDMNGRNLGKEAGFQKDPWQKEKKRKRKQRWRLQTAALEVGLFSEIFNYLE